MSSDAPDSASYVHEISFKEKMNTSRAVLQPKEDQGF